MGGMANTTLVQLKVDSEIKEDVSRIYENLGLDLPTAIRIFFKKSIAGEDYRLNYEKKIPDGKYMIKFEKVFKTIMFRKCRLKK